jgi:hypothetical protein
MNAMPMIFADGLMEASVNHGVARLVLAQVGADGKPVAVGQLTVPLAQLPALANGLASLVKQIEARAREAAPAAAEAPVPSAFTFGGR